MRSLAIDSNLDGIAGNPLAMLTVPIVPVSSVGLCNGTVTYSVLYQ